MSEATTSCAPFVVCIVAAGFLTACSADESAAEPSNTFATAAGGSGGGAGAGGSSQVGGGGSAIGFDGGTGGFDSGLDPDAPCLATSVAAQTVKRPVDVIFLVDNSASMGPEIGGVENNINQGFAGIMETSGIDYRVIMISKHGASSQDAICVGPPLGGAPCTPLPAEPANTARFFHYSTPVDSTDSLCVAKWTYNGAVPDQFGLAPSGWSSWLRSDAFKVIVELTDDQASCSPFIDANTEAGGSAVAAAFDAQLLAWQPKQFGDASNRQYVFHSIVGLAANDPATDAWPPSSPIVTSTCPGGVAPGTAYQALSILTGGLRFPLCQLASYDVVFLAIAEGVSDVAEVACKLAVPEPEPGKEIDPTTLVVSYTPGSGGPAEKFYQVPNAAQCATGRFFVAGGLIELCPDTCQLVQSDPGAKIDIMYGCAVDIPE